jgi:CYTH domain-containing protein
VTHEIERRFLVEELPPGLPPGTPVRQGYVALDGDVSVRVREAAAGCTLTVKGGIGRTRVEVERKIDADEFAALWELSEGRRVAKSRAVVPLDGLRIEVDVFEDALAGLVIAEVEFPSSEAADAFAPPPWFGEEVTGRPEWGNPSLAVRGRPDQR